MEILTNTNYLVDNYRKSKLNSLLISHNPLDTADFPTTIQKTTISAIDSSFIHFLRQRNIVIFPIRNGQSDHDAELITIHNIGFYDQIYNIIYIRRINENSLNDFKYILNFELWEDIFAE